MTKQAGFLRWFIPAALLFAAGFALGTFYDFKLNTLLYTPDSLFAALWEAFGWYPAFIPAIFLALLGLTQPKSAGDLPKRLLFGLVAFGGFAALYLASYHYLDKRHLVNGLYDPAFYIWLAAGLMIVVVCVLSTHRLQGNLRQQLALGCIMGSAFLVMQQVITYVLKLVWGRMRFDDMILSGKEELFTPWFQPFGPGGSSFPSGHTANAACILVLLFLCDLFPQWARHKKLILIICWSYIAIMAYSRILIGRHFLTDTLASCVIVGLLFSAFHNSKFYQKAVEDARPGHKV